MIVCVCKNVKTSDIQKAICSGACRMRDLCQELDVTKQCAKCAPDVLEILRANRQQISIN